MREPAEEIITVEIRTTYQVSVHDVDWTEGEWEDAREAAIRGDTDFEAWDAVQDRSLAITDSEVVHVHCGLRT